MPRRKKYRKTKEIFSEKTEEEKTDVQSVKNEKNPLPEQIEEAVENLYYISETDAKISAFIGKPAEAVTAEVLLNQIGNATDAPIEEKSFTEFFARLTEIQDWFGDEEKVTAQKYAQLKELLEKNLKDLKVFRVGQIELDVYVVGLDVNDILLGIKTKAVET